MFAPSLLERMRSRRCLRSVLKSASENENGLVCSSCVLDPETPGNEESDDCYLDRGSQRAVYAEDRSSRQKSPVQREGSVRALPAEKGHKHDLNVDD